MQLSALHRRHAARAPPFVNHTPRQFEITPFSPSQSPETLASATTMAWSSAGLPYTHPAMGQASSSVFERDSIRKASGSILREDTIQIEEQTGNISRPDSWSIHCDRTDQAPYLSTPPEDRKIGDGMNTTLSLPRLPRDNASHDLAFFLRTTGPTAPHRRPSTVEHPRRAAVPKSALRFLKRQKRSAAPLFATYDKPVICDGSEVTRIDRCSHSGVLRDEGGLLQEVPNGVEQRETSYGRRYLALQVHIPSPLVEEDIVPTAGTALPNHDILESQVSVSFADDINSSDVLDTWLMSLSKDNSRRGSPTPPRKSSTHLPLGDENTVRFVDQSSSPVRPAASNPPTPRTESTLSMPDSFREKPVKRSLEACRALSSHPVREAPSITALPKLSLPTEEFPVKRPRSGKEVEIKHPAPRRFASHPVLLQRASSIASTLYPRSVSDSPGPPPPKSPLRLRRDPRTIESVIASHSDDQKPTPKLAPSILPAGEYNRKLMPVKPTVITECTGPIKRPRSRGKNPICHPAYPSSRKERDERIRQRKLRDRPPVPRTIDSVVNATPPLPLPTRRLRKARPQIQIPELRPAPLVTRASSSASSTASWKKVTETTRTPVSPVPSRGSPTSNGEKTGYTPVSPMSSVGSASPDAKMTLSPVMLVAEEIPVPKAKSPAWPAKLIIKEGKSYAPRPRSASIPRMALKRRSRTAPPTPGAQSPSRTGSPAGQKLHDDDDDTPPLPSPPPNRALPPTPPASGSEKPGKSKSPETKKELPIPPAYEIAPKLSSPSKRIEAAPHVATQAQRRSFSSRNSGGVGGGAAGKTARFDARLIALEKQNAMLSAALMAMLRTNGEMNLPLAIQAESDVAKPMAWESRIARRSAASHAATSHAASSSNGSALEMYMSTRRGSRHGC